MSWRAYLNNWKEYSPFNRDKYALHLFIAYDLKYFGTDITNFNIIEADILETVNSVFYIDNTLIDNEINVLLRENVANARELKLIFGEGYAMKRNTVLYFALKHKMDCLIFLDDDEYPIANIQIGDSVVWKE